MAQTNMQKLKVTIYQLPVKVTTQTHKHTLIECNIIILYVCCRTPVAMYTLYHRTHIF